jgi:hypothetical protein
MKKVICDLCGKPAEDEYQLFGVIKGRRFGIDISQVSEDKDYGEHEHEYLEPADLCEDCIRKIMVAGDK